MKKMRKLLPAFAMLLVSAIMMSTASFAWFTMNETVTATGMTVTAKSSGGLVIASGINQYGTPDDSRFGDTADLSNSSDAWNNDATKIEPVSRGFVDTDAWFYAKAASSTSFGVNGDGYKPVDPGDLSAYAYQTALYFKTMDESHNGTDYEGALRLREITVANNTSALNQSLRVALRVMTSTEDTATGTWYFFAPLRADDAITNKYIAGSATGAVTAYGTDDEIHGYISTAGTTYNFDNVEVASLNFNEAVRVEVYVYFEGEDAACTSQNAQILDTLTIGLKFGVTTTDLIP